MAACASPQYTMTEVQLHQISKRYDSQHPVITDLCLTAACHQITALLGPSGCGKTTILKMIAGLLRPDAGDITFDGRSVLDVPAERRGAVMVFQHHLLFPHLSAADNVAFGLKMRRLDRARMARRVAEMLAMVKLADLGHRRPHQLSAGQRQRVALARALVVEPSVLLLDEPLSNLDAHLRDEMRELILGLQRQLGITTIVVTHDQEEAVILGDQIALLFAGKLHQMGPPPDFYDRPVSRRVARFFGGVNFIPGAWQNGVVETAWGRFYACLSDLPDGPVLLTIRPERVRLGDGAGENRLVGRVVGRVYAGTHTRLKVAIPTDADPLVLEVTSSALNPHDHPTGSEITLHLPPEHVWLLPPDAP